MFLIESMLLLRKDTLVVSASSGKSANGFVGVRISLRLAFGVSIPGVSRVGSLHLHQLSRLKF